MCYSNYKDFGRDTRKDDARETKERREPRVEAKDFKFWAFPRRSKEFTVEEPEKVADRSREKV
jgi:hypothetical protein